MEFFVTVFPITAVVAIIVFVGREILDALRRRAANKRRVGAIKRLISRELEVNKWAIKSLSHVLDDIDHSASAGREISINANAAGAVLFESHFDSQLQTSYPLPVVRREELSRYLIEIAVLDEKLLPVAEDASDALSDLDHLRSNILIGVGESEGFRDALTDYGRRELNDINLSLGKLYQACTGKPYDTHKVR